MDDLTGPDRMAERFPIPVFETLIPKLKEIRRQIRIRRKEGDSAEGKAAAKAVRKFRRNAKVLQADYLNASVGRAMFARTGFRERLTRFWADHFTAEGKAGILRNATSTYVEEAIRPNLAGDFATLLTAAVTHPLMLIYLDQIQSAGPRSFMARKKGRGLNENLAREVLELHTMGVDGSYTQTDVRELAKLLTGLSFVPHDGFQFRKIMVEPGPETILGKSYGGDVPDIRDIHAFLADIAVHPETARHIAWKLARHFVADVPDLALVDHVAERFRETGGDLSAVYEALLSHPAAWEMPDRKTKQPFDFVTSSLRALNVAEPRLTSLKAKDTVLYLASPMRVMGQDWESPTGPDGWPEEAADWITPQGLAGRLQWAMTVPRVARPDLPDPRAFVSDALGSRASEALQFAAQSAETKWEGVGLILASPEFQRR